METEKFTPVVFTGKTGEYFGIWIVNLLLSLVTLGIYSAWAKVRRKKYFYQNTLIDNVGFDYHANPLSILKGRSIAFVVFLIYAFAETLGTYVPTIIMLILFLLLPWLVVRASIFNARNSSHRGLRFNFIGTARQAFYTFVALPLITVLTLGLATPYASRQKNKFLVDSHKFGVSQFDMQATTGDFYSVYLKLSGILLLSGIIVLILALTVGKSFIPNLSPPVPGVLGFVQNSSQSHLTLAENEVSTTVQPEAADVTPDPEFAPEMLDAQNAAMAEDTLANQDKEKSSNKDDKFKEMMKNPMAGVLVLCGILLYLLFIFVLMSYLQARIGNLIWNSTKLDNISFQSSLRTRDLMWIYITNFLAIMLSFGMATPWAQIRMAKYRADKLALNTSTNFDQFVGNNKAEAKATGEEIADMFDIDISFG